MNRNKGTYSENVLILWENVSEGEEIKAGKFPMVG